jgi:hypothetical protein
MNCTAFDCNHLVRFDSETGAPSQTHQVHEAALEGLYIHSPASSQSVVITV